MDNVLGESLELPQENEWTRFELTREFDEHAGKYLISLSMGGVEVVKVEDEQNMQGQHEDTEICSSGGYGQITGFIRKIVVLEKF